MNQISERRDFLPFFLLRAKTRREKKSPAIEALAHLLPPAIRNQRSDSPLLPLTPKPSQNRKKKKRKSLKPFFLLRSNPFFLLRSVPKAYSSPFLPLTPKRAKTERKKKSLKPFFKKFPTLPREPGKFSVPLPISCVIQPRLEIPSPAQDKKFADSVHFDLSPWQVDGLHYCLKIEELWERGLRSFLKNEDPSFLFQSL